MMKGFLSNGDQFRYKTVLVSFFFFHIMVSYLKEGWDGSGWHRRDGQCS